MNDQRQIHHESAFDFARQSLAHLTGPSGGISYHWTAIRYRHSLWREFISTVGQWLNENWRPVEKQILIFGSSAGWTLDENFINQFRDVLCVEPDPMARLLFRLRFPNAQNLSFVADAQILPWFTSDASGDQLARFLEANQQSAILFSNLLGQIPLLARGKDRAFMERAQASFLSSLKNRNWASYHDVFSTEEGEVLNSHPRFHASQPVLTSETLAPLFFAEKTQITDHETLWLSAHRRTDFAIWKIRPNTQHVIGMIKSRE